MKYVCDATDGKTWFRIETEQEAEQESRLLNHAVEKYFRREKEVAIQSYQPTSTLYIETEIGLNAHIQRHMPHFLTLRDGEGNGLATAMIPISDEGIKKLACIIVGAGNSDPYPQHEDAIKSLAEHFDITLNREDCFPYRR